jgi:CheY-like chemotaxis protein
LLDVLIVDDHVVNRQILTEQVRRWGMTPTAVPSGPAALEALSEAERAGHSFGLVLLDANMPDMDGFQVAEQIAKRPALTNATVMMLSSSGELADQARCTAAGISSYLVKPVHASDLLTAIGRAVSAKRASAPATPASRTGAMARGLTGRPMRILLVEDNLVNQRVASGLLGRRGHQVTVAQNGAEALEKLADDTFDMILMDLQMPVMGGLEATIAIRERERQTGTRVRIVAMTAHAMASDRERCLAAGMDGYLSKPINPADLFAAVEEPTLESAPPVPASEAAAPATSAPVDEVDPGTFDEQALEYRLFGERALIADILRLFREDLPIRLEAIRSALDRHDMDGVHAAAHALTGAAGNVSAIRLADAARVLEHLGATADSAAAEQAWKRVSSEAGRFLTVLEARLARSSSITV